MREFLLGLSLSVAFIVGFVVAHLAPRAGVLPAAAQSEARSRAQPKTSSSSGILRWEYACVETKTAAELHEWAQDAGRKGWEMAGAAGGVGVGAMAASYQLHRVQEVTKRQIFIWCFKRRLNAGTSTSPATSAVPAP